MITLKKVGKSLEKRTILSGVSMQVNPGELLCILGPSGSGKTTLMNLLIAAEKPTSGAVTVDGVDIASIPPLAMRLYRRRCGVVFQDLRLLPHGTVQENIAFPLEVCGAPKKEIAERVTELLKILNLTKQADLFPNELSAGQKTLTAIARATVHEPMILFADEPTSNLDADEEKEILDLLKTIHKSGTTVVIATHDNHIAKKLKARVLEMKNGKVTSTSKKAAPKSQAHNILKTPTTKSAPQKKSPKDKRKVKITAVHSEH